MSGDEPAGDAQGQQRVTHIILRADGWFDGPDRVLPVAAYELNGRAMADSVVHGHAGFVPDYYLAGLGPEAAASAADLVAAGLWGRAEGGYRVLDQEVAAFLLERQRKSDEEAARAHARQKAKEDEGLAELAEAMLAAPPCAVCGTPSARIELVAPGGLPAEWERWPGTVRDTFLHREPGQWYLLFDGVAAGNGYGDPIEASRAVRSGLRWASPRSARPGSTTMRGSARTAMPPIATSTGTCQRPGMAIVPAATARAWTRTGAADACRRGGGDCQRQVP